MEAQKLQLGVRSRAPITRTAHSDTAQQKCIMFSLSDVSTSIYDMTGPEGQQNMSHSLAPCRVFLFFVQCLKLKPDVCSEQMNLSASVKNYMAGCQFLLRPENTLGGLNAVGNVTVKGQMWKKGKRKKRKEARASRLLWNAQKQLFFFLGFSYCNTTYYLR